MEVLGFPGCVLGSSALAPGRSTSLCGALQRRKPQWRGQRQIQFWFFLLCEQKLFWGSLCTACFTASVPNAPSVPEPWGPFLQGRGSPRLLLAGRRGQVRCTTSLWHPDSLQPLAAGMRATRFAGACCFYSKKPMASSSRPLKQTDFVGKLGIQFGADPKLVAQGARDERLAPLSKPLS